MKIQAPKTLEEFQEEIYSLALKLYMRGYRAGYKANRRNGHTEEQTQLPLPHDLEEK